MESVLCEGRPGMADHKRSFDVLREELFFAYENPCRNASSKRSAFSVPVRLR